MATSLSTPAGGVIVVSIQPGPQIHGHPGHEGFHGLQPCDGFPRFNVGRPLALGTVQIMIGLMMLLFGITMAFNADTLGVYSGFFVWGALFYIIAGSLTVAAGRSTNRCLVNGTLGMNVVAAVVATTGIILYSLDAAGILIYCYDYTDYWSCYNYMTRMQGFSSILAIFNFLELIVSIVVAGFACNATCKCNTMQPPIVVTNASATGHPAPDAQAPYVPTQVVIQTKNSEEPGTHGTIYPPPYNSEGFAHPAQNP